MNTNKGNFQMWLAIGAILLFIGLPELVLRGLGEGKLLGIITGLLFVAASAGAFWQAFAEKRRFEEDEKRRTEENPAGQTPLDGDVPR